MTDDEPIADWRGVHIIPGDIVIYITSNGVMTEAKVVDAEADGSDRITVTPIRRSNADATYRTVMAEVRVGYQRVTVVGHLPASPLPTITQDQAVGRSIAEDRRAAMRASGRYWRPRRR